MFYLIAIRQRWVIIAIRQRWVIIFIGGVQILVTQITEGQDLSSIDKKNPVKISGGANATQAAYKAWGINNRRDPYYWLFNANLNFDILGISIPFLFSFQYGIPIPIKLLKIKISYESEFN
jgi:hypothetical protein